MRMKKSSDENIAFPRVRNFLRLWSEVAQSTFPFMREEFGELDEMDRLFVTVCESVVKPEAFEYAKWKGIGRPTTSRTSVFKAFLFKALYDIPTTRELARRLRRDVRARRLCGWNSAGDVPSDERFFSHLLDSHGGRHVHVRTPKKVSQHLMYGVLVIAEEETMRLLC